MAISKIVQNSIDETSVSLGVKITNVQVANSSYTVLDDTAVNVGGGYIVITGAGFKSNPQVIIGQNTACSITFIDSTTIRAEVPAKDAGTYPVYVVNTDGAVGIRVPGLTYSGFPTWVTGSTLPSYGVDEAISIQLEATGANTYALQTGSTLPSGVNLAANGLITGTVTGLGDDTLYNFTIEAIDTENQESPRAFNVTIGVADEYFNQTVLLLSGDGTSGANNNVFRDSSNNNFAITRNGDTTQGTFSPFSAEEGRWSIFFDNNADNLTFPASTDFAFGTGDFTIEFWAYIESISNLDTIYIHGNTGSTVQLFFVDGKLRYNNNSVAAVLDTTTTIPTGEWMHFAIVRSSGTAKWYLNGVEDASVSDTTNWSSSATNLTIGNDPINSGRDFHGFISNLSVVKGTAVYTSAFTPSSSPVSPSRNNQKLLTCYGNRFGDFNTDTTAKTVTINGNPKVTSFSPFESTGVYSASVNGGSGYFDGTGDNLSFTANSAFAFGTGDFSIEAWVYPLAAPGGAMNICGTRGEAGSTTAWNWGILNNLSSQMYTNGALVNTGAGTVPLNTWTLISIVRSSGTLKSYINGVEKASTSNTQDLTTTNFWIGMTGGTAEPFNGYISSLRLIKGTAITPSVPTSPYIPITNTSLLCNFTNAGIFDYTGKNVLYAVGTPSVNTAITKYGTGSMEFDGTGDYLTTPASPDLILSTGDFTIEGWFYYSTTPPAASGYDYLWGIGGSGTGGLGLYVQGGVPKIWSDTLKLTTTGSISATTWYHIAVVRSSGTLTVYLDGVSIGSVSLTNNLSGGATSGFNIARWANYPDTTDFTGLIDDLRITKGVARYTTGFTPPTSAHRKR